MSEDRFDFRAAFGLPSNPDPNFEVSDLAPPADTSGGTVSLPEAVGPEEQNLIEFYNPFERQGDPSFIPGVRFPKLGTIGTQDFGNFLTVPANIAEERVRLGGDLFSVPGQYEPSTAEIADVLKKYNLRDDDRTIGKLLRSNSPEDLEAQASVYARREAREEQIAVDNPGLLGLGTRLLWNFADPTFIVAGHAATASMTTRIANSSTKTGAAIRFASDGMTKGERFAVGAGTALMADIPLETANTYVDPARDPLMTAGFLLATPILGGALNQLGRTNADELAEATKRLDSVLADNIRGSSDGGSMGAAQSGPVPFQAADDIPGAPAQAGKFTIGTPLNFLARSADAVTRSIADKLSWNPNTRSTQGVTAAEAQRRTYEAQAVRIRSGRMAAKSYFGKKGLSPSTEELDDFFRQVGLHMTGTRVSKDPDIIRAAQEYAEGFADGLAYLKDPNYLPGRDRPQTVRPKDPPEGGAAPAGDKAPDEPNTPKQSAQAAPEPAAETPQPNPYFGRKSFRGGEAPAKPEEAPAVPSRAEMGSRLKSIRKAAEGLLEEGDTESDLAKALQQIDRVAKGVAIGSPEAFQARYADALERLARALEDNPQGDDILAEVVQELDSRAAPDMEMPASQRLDEVEEFERWRNDQAKLYDRVLAQMEFEGKYKKPMGAASTAALGASLAGAGMSMGAWMAEADQETIAGSGLLAASIGAIAGAITGRARVRKWENNTPGVAIFLGPTSPGVDKQALAEARKMEAAGKSRDEIWEKTGWGRFADGTWVTEIDEPLGRLIDDLFDDPKFLPEVLKGKRFFEAEPELRKMVIQSRELLAMMANMSNTDGLARPWRKDMAISTSLRPDQQLRVTLHEINHLVQGVRGVRFSKQGEFEARALGAQQRLDEIHGEIVDISTGDNPDADRLEALMSEYDELLPQAEGGQFYQYLTLAAEAESRLVEGRMGMTRAERRKRPPWQDYDVPEKDLWSGKASTIAASLGSDLRLFRNPEWFEKSVKQGTFADGELAGYQYFRSEEAGVTAWVEDLGDGEGSWNWDWNENLDKGTIFADNPNASPSQSARAFAFAQASFERLTSEGKFDVLTFEGLKKPKKEGQVASGHERVQEFLMARADTPGYVASKGSWQTKIKDPDTGEMIEVTRSSFAFSREGMDLAEVWKGIRRGDVEITQIQKAKAEPQVAASRRYEDPEAESRAAQPADDYRGIEEARFIDYDPAYLPRRFNKKGWDRVFLGPQFRGNLNKLGNRIGDIIYRTNSKGMDELAASRPTPITGQELAWRIGRQYAKTVSELMNPAQGGKSPFRKVSMDDREAAKEVVRESLKDGELLDFNTEEAMEMILDLVAPIRKNSAENPRLRPRVEMKLDADQDADIIDMFEWNAEALFTQYARTTSGYAGLLRAGFRSEADLRNQIDQIRANADRDPKRQGRAKREAEMLEMMTDAILGRPKEDLMSNPHWTWFANQMRRLNFGNLMNNTGFLAISEVLGAVTQVGLVRMVSLFPEFRRYYKLARAGDPAVRNNLFYLADVTMGHGSAQVRSRVGQTSRWDPDDGSINDPGQGRAELVDRFTRKQANLVGRFSGMAPMQEWLRMTIVTAEAQDWVKAARKGGPLYSARRMQALGVDEAMWQRISSQLRKWGDDTSPDTRQKVPNMDLSQWDDAEALNVWINALDRNARRLVMEGDVGHQAFWLRNRPSAQLLFQFLNFPINAFSKHMGFALNTRDARAGAEVMAMALGGALGVMARTLATGYAQDTEEEREAYLSERFTWEQFAKGLLYYNAHGSLAPNVYDGAMFLGQQAGLPVEPYFQQTRGSGLPGDPFTGNPTYSRITKAPQVLGELADGTPFSEQDVAGVVKHFAPLGNHIAMNALLDRIFEFLPDEEGSVEDQAQN